MHINFPSFFSLLEAGAAVSAKNSIGKTAAMLCGFVGLKHAHSSDTKFSAKKKSQVPETNIQSMLTLVRKHKIDSIGVQKSIL